MTEQRRTWTDHVNDVWYEDERGDWTMYGPDERQPHGVPNVSPEKMRAFYPEFPF